MKTILKTVLAVLGVMLTLSCAEAKIVRCKGPVQVQKMELGDFNSIIMNGSADIFLVQQNSCEVTVRANEEVFQYLNFRVENNVLILETKDRANIAADTYDITIGLPDISAITMNGACDAKILDGYTCKSDLSVKVNGAGDLSLGGVRAEALHVLVNGAGDVDAESIDVKTLAVTVNGAGDVLVSGKADVAFFKVSGAGVVDARGLKAESVETKRAGVAVIRLQ